MTSAFGGLMHVAATGEYTEPLAKPIEKAKQNGLPIFAGFFL